VIQSPKSSLLHELRSVALERSKSYADELFTLRGLWTVNYRYRPNRFERDLSYSLVLAQTVGQGCCYVTYGDARIDEDLLSRDAREIWTDDPFTNIAVLDAIYSAFEKHPVASFDFRGTSDEKAVRRAEIISDEVVYQLGGSPAGKRVLNVGVMGNFVPHLTGKGVTFVGSDFESKLLESGLQGAELHHGDRTIELIETCDVVLATGMTMTSNTIDAILDEVKRCGKKLVLFAATGCHFGEEYCGRFGVDAVVSEPQPQYMFQGTSHIDIFRRAGS
jgi:putative heavy-metal chelation protein